MSEIQALIDEAVGWQKLHREAGRRIEAAAAAIRVKALQDALAAITPKDGER